MFDYNALRKWWYLPFIVYLIPNVLMCLFVIVFKLLLVDGIPVPLTASDFSIALIAVLIIVIFYYIKKWCQYFNKKAFAYKDIAPDKFIGILIFMMQLLDLISLVVFDFGRVGGSASSGNVFVRMVSYLPTDTLVLLYYGHYRKKGIPYFNLALYLVINVLKGWSGIWLILFFVEAYFQLSRLPYNKIVKRFLIIAVVTLAFYPTINKYKYIIRGGEDYQGRTAAESATELAIRLQHVNSAILVAQEASTIKKGLNDGEIMPYYLDNRLGSYFSKINSVTLQRYLTINYLIDKDLFSPGTDTDDFGWFVHVGIVSWLFVLSPISIFFFLIYITLLIITPFVLNHLFLKSEGLIPVMQTLTFSYVFHGWLTVHIGYISGVIMYISFNALVALIKKRKIAEMEQVLTTDTTVDKMAFPG